MKTLKISAWIASIFSIVFSLSMLSELSKTANLLTLILSGSFLVFTVVFVEWLKVTELSNRFRNQKSNIYVIVFSFVFSISVSTIGIWLWLNKSQEIKVETANSYNEKLLELEKLYNSKADSINNIPFSSEYNQVLSDLSYWKTRSAATIEERNQIRENIVKLESKRTDLYNSSVKLKESLKTDLNKQKQAQQNLLLSNTKGNESKAGRNEFISVVFFLMVGFVEFIIIFIQYRIATYFTGEQSGVVKMVKDFELRNLSSIDVNKVKYSVFHGMQDWEEIKLLYNLLIELNVIDKEGKVQEKASNKISNYYLKINSL